jgi:hypothetical protein
MAEFQPPIVEEAYQAAVHDLVPEFVWPVEFIDPEQYEDSVGRANELRQELEAAGLEKPDDVFPFQKDLEQIPEELREKVKELFSVNFIISSAERYMKEDVARREVLGTILQGLGVNNFETTQYLHVAYFSEHEFPGHTRTGPVNAIDSVPVVIAAHPVSKERGLHFTAETAFIAAKMLTPEIVEVVLADDTRERPTIKQIHNGVEPNKGKEKEE